MSAELVIWLPDEAATERLGERLGAQARAGDVFALVGDLGAGKTCLVRGLARGLGVDDPAAVASPTYLLVVEHPGPIPLLHMDAYLPGKLQAFLADGGLDYLGERRGVIAVEWAERVPALWSQHTVRIALAPRERAGVHGREARITGGLRDAAGLDGAR